MRVGRQRLLSSSSVLLRLGLASALRRNHGASKHISSFFCESELGGESVNEEEGEQEPSWEPFSP